MIDTVLNFMGSDSFIRTVEIGTNIIAGSAVGATAINGLKIRKYGRRFEQGFDIVIKIINILGANFGKAKNQEEKKSYHN